MTSPPSTPSHSDDAGRYNVRTTATCSGAAYECWLPLPKKKLIPTKLNHSVARPISATIAAERPFQPEVARACRYAAYTTQVMNAHTSLGSQPQ